MMLEKNHDFKGYAISYNVEVINSFNSALQLKHLESAIESKLADLLSELKRLNCNFSHFKFMTTLVLEFKKMMGQNMTPFIRTQKQKQ